METLELLEEILMEFDGTVLLVSHDREFMDNVVTSLIVLDGHGGVSEHVGGYSDWESRGGRLLGVSEEPENRSSVDAPGQPSKQTAEVKPAPPSRRKLSYKEQRELAGLPGKIEALERQQAELEAKMAEPGFYQADFRDIQQVTDQLSQVQGELETVFNRWAELDSA
jgi:ATP-binding cassette subfamily F protein uup